MSQIEKQLSDYQQNECDTLKIEEPQVFPVEKELCPTCVKNPNFKLENNWWEIQEGYSRAIKC